MAHATRHKVKVLCRRPFVYSHRFAATPFIFFSTPLKPFRDSDRGKMSIASWAIEEGTGHTTKIVTREQVEGLLQGYDCDKGTVNASWPNVSYCDEGTGRTSPGRVSYAFWSRLRPHGRSGRFRQRGSDHADAASSFRPRGRSGWSEAISPSCPSSRSCNLQPFGGTHDTAAQCLRRQECCGASPAGPLP